MTIARRHPFARGEAATLLVLSLLFILVAVLRQDFNGDGVRHIQQAAWGAQPYVGAPQWLLFPSLAWSLLHPLAAFGLITSFESAIRALLFMCVASGIVYLWSLHVWLSAEGLEPRARTAAIVLAGATMTFLTLYTDITEVQIAGAGVIAALAWARARAAAGRCDERTVIALVGAIALAALVYQAFILALGLVLLVVPLETIFRKKTLLGSAAILVSVPAIMIVGRIVAGEPPGVAILRTFVAEQSPLVRASLLTATPLKWLAAALGGPPLAIVGLRDFQGLPSLARGLFGATATAEGIVNAGRFAFGFVLVVAGVWAIVRSRDWRIALAVLGIMVLPVIRNNQYTNNKFFVMWPVLVAIASTKFNPRHVMPVALLVLGLNGWLVAQDVAGGRARYAVMQTLYQRASPDTCYFTSDWSPPFPYLWPGTRSAIISDLWLAADVPVTTHPLTISVQRCFCDSAATWTDTTAEEAARVADLGDHFNYTSLPLHGFVFQAGDGTPMAGGTRPVFAYSPARKAELCAIARTR